MIFYAFNNNLNAKYIIKLEHILLQWYTFHVHNVQK